MNFRVDKRRSSQRTSLGNINFNSSSCSLPVGHELASDKSRQSFSDLALTLRDIGKGKENVSRHSNVIAGSRGQISDVNYEQVKDAIPEILSELVFQLKGEVTTWVGSLNVDGQAIKSILSGEEAKLSKKVQKKFRATMNGVLNRLGLPDGKLGIAQIMNSLKNESARAGFDKDSKIEMFRPFDKKWGLLTPIVKLYDGFSLRITAVPGKTDIWTLMDRISKKIM